MSSGVEEMGREWGKKIKNLRDFVRNSKVLELSDLSFTFVYASLVGKTRCTWPQNCLTFFVRTFGRCFTIRYNICIDRCNGEGGCGSKVWCLGLGFCRGLSLLVKCWEVCLPLAMSLHTKCHYAYDRVWGVILRLWSRTSSRCVSDRIQVHTTRPMMSNSLRQSVLGGRSGVESFLVLLTVYLLLLIVPLHVLSNALMLRTIFINFICMSVSIYVIALNCFFKFLIRNFHQCFSYITS